MRLRIVITGATDDASDPIVASWGRQRSTWYWDFDIGGAANHVAAAKKLAATWGPEWVILGVDDSHEVGLLVAFTRPED